MSTALVTGGASGIGAALVARLRAEGFEVQVLDLTTGFDVGAPHDWDTVDAVDVACLNAGVLGGPADPAELTLEGYRRALAVNVDGVVLGVRRLARVMAPGSRIVCTASLAGLTAVPDDPVYALTKHAVVGFVRSVAPALEAKGISINAVCPGFVETRWLQEALGPAYEGAKAGYMSNAALRKVCTPDDIARAVLWLLEGSELVTGEFILVDGGAHLGGSPTKAR